QKKTKYLKKRCKFMQIQKQKKMKKLHYFKIVILFIISILIINKGESQVLINSTGGTPDASAMLEIQSTTQGLLIPRMTTSDREKIDNGTGYPAEGLLVFDTDEDAFFIFGNGKWTDLSMSAEIWSQSSSNVYLTNTTYNVGIGTTTPSGKFVVKADASQADEDALFEIQDKDGKPIFVVTSEGARLYVKEYTAKGVSGGFAVGRYGAAKGMPDTTYFMVTPDSTRVFSRKGSTGVSGGFAVGRYGAAKGPTTTFFTTNEDSTRVYSRNGSTGVSGGFAVGRYGAAKGEADSLFFFTNIDSTRVYTDGSGSKGVSGGFAVGRYGAAKGGANTYMHMTEENYFIGHQ
ncbi:MAG: hypothetical protein K8R13_05265, partial [Methanococcoides sp.]|nr:hypothetical protein [Methanococcoides sp.]